MLVLTRKVGERIHIGDVIVVTVVRLQGDKDHDANLGPVIFSLGLRVYLADF